MISDIMQKQNMGGIDMIHGLEFLYMMKKGSFYDIIFSLQGCWSDVMQMGNYICMIL